MTDDLVERLLDWPYQGEGMAHEAAALIEQLVATTEVLTADNARLLAAATALRDDMLERSQLRIDAINGEQYRIVNAGAGVWMDFCAALNGKETNGL